MVSFLIALSSAITLAGATSAAAQGNLRRLQDTSPSAELDNYSASLPPDAYGTTGAASRGLINTPGGLVLSGDDGSNGVEDVFYLKYNQEIMLQHFRTGCQLQSSEDLWYQGRPREKMVICQHGQHDNAWWVVRAADDADEVSGIVLDREKVRLEHRVMGCYLHGNLIESPATRQWEVACIFDDYAGEIRILWQMMYNQKPAMGETGYFLSSPLRLMNVAMSQEHPHYLHSHLEFFEGSQEITVLSREDNNDLFGVIVLSAVMPVGTDCGVIDNFVRAGAFKRHDDGSWQVRTTELNFYYVHGPEMTGDFTAEITVESSDFVRQNQGKMDGQIQIRETLDKSSRYFGVEMSEKDACIDQPTSFEMSIYAKEKSCSPCSGNLMERANPCPQGYTVPDHLTSWKIRVTKKGNGGANYWFSASIRLVSPVANLDIAADRNPYSEWTDIKVYDRAPNGYEKIITNMESVYIGFGATGWGNTKQAIFKVRDFTVWT